MSQSNVLGLSAADLYVLLGVKPATLRQWVRRGHVRKLGRDCYDARDVLTRTEAPPTVAATSFP